MIERLSGPKTHVTWTPDHTPKNEIEMVVLVRENDLVALESQLTFSYFATQNAARASRWHGGTSWSLSDWGVAMAGEAGEVCDAIKKFNRIRDGFSSNNPRQPKNKEAAIIDILKEIGDTGCYLDLLAQACGSSLGACMRQVFNDVSVRENHPERV
jgi:NTP pyrophosphatase (non-canonical NTP hydrolase)